MKNNTDALDRLIANCPSYGMRVGMESQKDFDARTIRKSLTMQEVESIKILKSFVKQCEETDFKLPSYGVPDSKYCSCCKANPDHQHFSHCAYIKAKKHIDGLHPDTKRSIMEYSEIKE